MKRHILITILALITNFAFCETIEETYDIGLPKITDKDNYQILTYNNALNTAVAGNPALPYFAVKILLPPGEEATKIEFIGMNEVKLEGEFKIYPYQPSRPLSSKEKAEFVVNNSIYNTYESYPSSQTGQLSTSYMNGYGIALSSFTPVRYNPAVGDVFIYQKVLIRITTKPSVKANLALNNLNPDSKFKEKVRRYTSYNKAIDLYKSLKETTGDYKLLIISPAQFQTEFDSLREIYLRRGIKSEFYSIEDINTIMTGQDSQEKIRNYIIQEYQDNSVEHVLLGGDVEHVPYRGFHCYVQSGSGYQDDNIPADLYYSALDGTWNDDNDNLWGEIGEDDLLPDISVARLPFSDTADLHNMLHKNMSYQENPVVGELQHPLMAGEHLWSNPLSWGADYLDLLIGYHDDNGYTTIGIPDDDSITYMYDRDATWSASDIINEINLGHSFIHHSGHCNSNYAMRLYTSDITNSNFNMVNGVDHNYTLVYTHGCICGAFDDNDCIAEHMLFIDNFVVGGAFNSRYGWFNEGQTEGPSAHLHREFVDAMYNEKIDRIGASHMESKIQTSPWVTAPGQHEEGALRWCFYDCNILGDPAMAVWTDEPISINVTYPSTLTIGIDSININVSSSGVPMNNFNCTLFKNESLHGIATTDTLGNATIYIDPMITDPGDAELIVSGYNCLPQTYTISFIPAVGAYVTYESHILTEITGNSNGLPDYGEDCYLEISMHNSGAGDANDLNVNITYNSTGPWITITDSSEFYGNIPSGTSLSVPEGFRINIADNVPDQTQAEILVSAEDGTKEIWTSTFSLVLLAPVLDIGDFTIDDSNGGNGNMVLDPGETAIVTIQVINSGHSDGVNSHVELHTINPYVSITDTMYFIGCLPVGNMFNAIFEITLSDDIPLGEVIHLDCNFQAGMYYTEETFSAVVGIMIEDFETADFSKFEWQFAGIKDWVISDDIPYEGEYCTESGDITHNQSSEIFITMNILAEGDISFFSKVSSEVDWDFLQFKINGTLKDEWSGEQDWAYHSYAVSTGNHKFSWIYDKDGNTSGGSDRGWVDYVIFPPADYITAVDENNKEMNFISLYPNPCSEYLNVGVILNESSAMQIEIIDILGKTISIIDNIDSQIKGHRKYTINTSSLKDGIYFIKCTIDDKLSMHKFIHQSK